MNFQDLHELLRVELVRRIEQGTLTGSRLAVQAGFQQAHISNFLNRKRALCLDHGNASSCPEAVTSRTSSSSGCRPIAHLVSATRCLRG